MKEKSLIKTLVLGTITFLGENHVNLLFIGLVLYIASGTPATEIGLLTDVVGLLIIVLISVSTDIRKDIKDLKEK
jgi:hypothetical protein